MTEDLPKNTPDRNYNLPKFGAELGEGYLAFPEPLSESDYLSLREVLEQFCVVAIQILRDTEGKHYTPNSLSLRMTGLKGFNESVQIIESSCAHPADLERLFSDPVFSEPFAFLVKEIKESRIIDILEKESFPQGLSPSGESPAILARTTRDNMLKADIYLASRLDKKPKKDGQK